MCIGLRSVFRWPELDAAAFRWPELDFFNAVVNFRWLDVSIDDVLWTVVYVFESLALATMLCYFFIFCGCTL
ncbi:hypothetical protein C2S52_023193 [Perilla frutescens var. hirtella]|nr:hypothetical protein C2S52_023193 [Perilla frutescens var. hirtella]